MNFKTLLCRKGSDVSIGRLLLWIGFIILSFFWVFILIGKIKGDAPDSLVLIVQSLLVYVLGSKVREIFLKNNRNDGD